MDILKLLKENNSIKDYEIQDFRQWKNGLYYKLSIKFNNNSILFAKEYLDNTERNYSFHWQDSYGNLLTRWDNAPHHKKIDTFPHHKHEKNKQISNSFAISLNEVIEEITTDIS